MPTFIQRRNPSLVDNLRPDFLPLSDRNLYVELYNHSAHTNLVATGNTVVPFSTTRFNCAENDMFVVDSGQIEVIVPGLYEIYYKFNTGSGSGSAGETSISTWLEQDIAGGGFNEVLGSRTYGYAPPSPGWNNLFSIVTLFLETADVPSTFRVQSIVISPAGTPTAQIHQDGRIFRILNVIGLR